VGLDREPAIRLTDRTDACGGQVEPMQRGVQRQGAGADTSGNGGADPIVIRVVLVDGGDRAAFAVGAVDRGLGVVEYHRIGAVTDRYTGDQMAVARVGDSHQLVVANR